MPQIYIMAAVTLLSSLILWGGLTYLFTGYQTRYFWLLLLGLPLSALANLILKQQAMIVVGRAGHVQPGLGLAAPAWFLAFQVLLSPVVEEAIKIAPLLLIPVWRMVTSQATALWVGFMLGIGFGLGEAAFIAYAIGQAGTYDALPWYAFTGFLNERIMACFVHGVFAAILVMGIQRRGWFILSGYLTSLGLHLFLNTPTVLYQFHWISYELYNVLIVIPLIVLAIVFERLRRATHQEINDDNGKEILYWSREKPVTHC